MKFLKDWFQVSNEGNASSSQQTVMDEISGSLSGIAESERSHLAALSFILGRLAYADQDFSSEEAEAIRQVLQGKAEMNETQAKAVVDIIQHLSEWRGATDNYLVTRWFCDNADAAQKRELMRCLFLVSAADDSISSIEEKELKLIATEIQFPESEMMEFKAAYRDQRAVFQGMPRK